jgi:hypothetical protein
LLLFVIVLSLAEEGAGVGFGFLRLKRMTGTYPYGETEQIEKNDSWEAHGLSPDTGQERGCEGRQENIRAQGEIFSEGRRR